MNTEIKVGDKVRVREDAPRVYRDWDDINWTKVESYVADMDGDAATIKYLEGDDDNGDFEYLPIPLKYLIKVEEEAKEPKFKVGDRVRVKGCGYEPNLHKGDIGEVLDTNDKEQCFVLFKKSQAWIYTDCLEPYTEPTEQTESENKPYDGISEETANEISDMLEAYVKALSGIADNFDWQRYTADLAKEIAIAYAKQKRDVRLAVRAAKSVVEELKKQ